MRATKFLKLLALMGVASLAGSAATASVFEPVSDQQLVCESSDIVRGTVVEVNSVWEGSPRAIWTYAQIRVDEVLRGDRRVGETIEVKEIGGTVGDYTIVAHQFPTFRTGEETVVMISTWEEEPNALRVHGFGRGKFNIVREKDRPARADRSDLNRGRRPEMQVDFLKPAGDLDQLEKGLRGLSGRCENNGGGR